MIISGLQRGGMEEPPCLRWCSSSSGSYFPNNPFGISLVSCNLTRFYYEIEGWPVFEDVETIEANEKELELTSQDVEYTRVDL